MKRFAVDNLEKINIPDSVISIGESAFSSCKSLTEIIIPDSVTSIGKRAFYGCDALTEIVIPNSVTSIGSNPFMVCENLKEIKVTDDHPTLATIDGVLFDKKEKKLICYPYAFDAVYYSIPEGVSVIGTDAFVDFDKKIIDVPASVTAIEEDAFEPWWDWILVVERGSYAEQYAKEYDISYYTNAKGSSPDWLNN